MSTFNFANFNLACDFIGTQTLYITKDKGSEMQLNARLAISYKISSWQIFQCSMVQKI
jgi:hypothetical protein